MRKILLNTVSMSAGLSTAMLITSLSTTVTANAQTPTIAPQENTLEQQILSSRQQAIVPVAAYAAAGDMTNSVALYIKASMLA